jgi:cytochrome c oxidase cbb3-type subunit 3
MAVSRVVLLLPLLFLVPVTASAQDALHGRLLVASTTTIANEPELLALATTLAETAINEHCVACHGATLEGSKGVPSLVDYEWIWGIAGDEISAADPVHKIMQTVLYGIRDRDCPEETKSYGACPDTRYSEMPAYRMLGLTDAQLGDLTEYVLGLSGQDHDAAAAERAAAYTGLCVECHGEGGLGFKSYGGPDLTDDIWLYGGSREDIFASIAEGRMGYCPPYWDKLDAATIKSLGVYLYRRYMGY